MTGSRGPQSKPLALDVLDGNRGNKTKEELNLDQPTPEPTLFKAPDYLDEQAKKEFDKLAQVLYKNMLLTEIDEHQLALLCQAFARWVELEKQIQKTNNQMIIKDRLGNPIPNPLIKMSLQASDQVYKYLQTFGMSPSARTRVKMAGSKEVQEEDAWERFVKQRDALKKKHLVKNE